MSRSRTPKTPSRVGPTARRVTLENVHIRHTLPFNDAASPADIAISGTQVLVHRLSVSGKRVWLIVTQQGVTGPNVMLHIQSDEAGVAPHQRWATGLLVDSANSPTHDDVQRRIL